MELAISLGIRIFTDREDVVIYSRQIAPHNNVHIFRSIDRSTDVADVADRIVTMYLQEPPQKKPLPEDRWKEIVQIVESSEMCTICMDNDPHERCQLPCGHMYHEECLRDWFQHQSRCPLCNKSF